ncbi:Transmembrane protein [Stenotrophomonas geniculata]|uniref:DUF998 domain-containing protein n=1 Tax=Stenotrophomonas geniculata TaxID=86188 RepID=UPI00374C803A
MLRRNRLLLSAGLVPLPWFLFWTSVAALFAPGYNPLAQHASELLQAPTLASICGRIAAIGSGLGFVAFSIGVWRESGRRIAVGAICWMIFGISMLSIAGIVYLWLNVVGADPDGFRGLTQRLFSSINSLWPFLVALYLLRRGSSVLKAEPTY